MNTEPAHKQRKGGSFLLLRIGIALLLLSVLFLSIGAGQILQTLRTVRPFEGFVAAVCLFILFLSGGINVWILLNTMGTVSLPAFLSIYSQSWAVSLITPGQAGDASMIFLSKKYGIPLRRIGIAYLFDKGITIVVFLCIAGLGSYLLLGTFRKFGAPIIALILVLASGTLLIIRLLPRHQGPGKRIQDWLDQIRGEAGIFREKWHVLFLNTMITIIKWLVVSLAYFQAFLSLGARVPWPEIGVIPILSNLVGYIPISVAGIGTVEVTAAFLFSKVGVEQSVVVSAYIFLRIVQFLVALLMLGFFRTLGRGQ